MKNNGETHLFLQELFRMTHRITLYIFRTTFALFTDAVPLNNGSLQIPAYVQTLSLRLTEEIVNLRAHHVPR